MAASLAYLPACNAAMLATDVSLQSDTSLPERADAAAATIAGNEAIGASPAKTVPIPAALPLFGAALLVLAIGG